MLSSVQFAEVQIMPVTRWAMVAVERQRAEDTDLRFENILRFFLSLAAVSECARLAGVWLNTQRGALQNSNSRPLACGYRCS